MKLQALAKKPALIKIVIDDADTVETHGESIEFYIYDRYSMDLYMKLSALDSTEDSDQMRQLAYEIMLDENGKKIMSEGLELPIDLQIKAVEKTLISLGNLVTRTSTK